MVTTTMDKCLSWCDHGVHWLPTLQYLISELNMIAVGCTNSLLLKGQGRWVCRHGNHGAGSKWSNMNQNSETKHSLQEESSCRAQRSYHQLSYHTVLFSSICIFIDIFYEVYKMLSGAFNAAADQIKCPAFRTSKRLFCYQNSYLRSFQCFHSRAFPHLGSGVGCSRTGWTGRRPACSAVWSRSTSLSCRGDAGRRGTEPASPTEAEQSLPSRLKHQKNKFRLKNVSELVEEVTSSVRC